MRLTARNENSGLGAPGATGRFFPDPDERAKRRHVTTGARLDDQTTKRWRQSLSFAYSESDFLSFDPVAQDLTRPDTPPVSQSILQPVLQLGAGGLLSD